MLFKGFADAAVALGKVLLKKIIQVVREHKMNL